MLIYVLFGLFFVFFGILIFSLGSINSAKPAVETTAFLPKVSLLLAARNEEKLIRRSLDHIAALDYPTDLLEIWIGDDDSSDKTREIVTAFIKDKPQFKLKAIQNNLGKARGKANVIAQLAKHAKGEILLITDVDVALPKAWVKTMVAPFEDINVGIVSGTTMCEKGSVFATLQGIDWLHFMGYIKAFALKGISCTSVGNNMAVRTEAYLETGGYEVIDFSITEDYKLFEAVTTLGWNYRNLIGPGCLGKAWYIPDVLEMLHQRKRWLIGSRDLPISWKMMIGLYGLFYPALLITLIIFPLAAVHLWLAKFILQALFIKKLTDVNEEPTFSVLWLVKYEIYLLLNMLGTALFFLLPIKSIWKGREYSSKNVG